MKITHVKIENFRGIKKAELFLKDHTVIVGDNNTGKSSLLEAIDLVLGPERLSRRPIIDEHDFYGGKYLSDEKQPIVIKVEVVVIDLSDEQLSKFRNNLEFWNTKDKTILSQAPPNSTDHEEVQPALRVWFEGSYDIEDDDFIGQTYFASPVADDGGTFSKFSKSDKRECGFLFLRTLRTGSRALSLEHGTLLDIILRLEELRPQMWEDILDGLRKLSVAENPELGISPILENVQKGIRSFVPSEWGIQPHLKVSNLTRAHLRKIVTVFFGTGIENHSAPFQYQGTGTINTLVLTLLKMIADLKQNVIFAMEEPEIAIPPYTQKSIVNSVVKNSSQALFTSHSPYVLEEFSPSQILVVKREEGILKGENADYPPSIKPKKYRDEFKKRFCETLLARRVLIVEGRTEYDSIPIAARKLNDVNPTKFIPFESLGIAVINAETDSQVEPLGKFYKDLGKTVFAIYDQQSSEMSDLIKKTIQYPYESPETGFEKLVLNQTSYETLKKYALNLVETGEWPQHLLHKKPTTLMDEEKIRDSLLDYFKWSKGAGSIAELITICNEDEIPDFIKDTIISIMKIVEPKELNSSQVTE